MPRRNTQQREKYRHDVWRRYGDRRCGPLAQFSERIAVQGSLSHGRKR
jgi:hypothetical protein